MIMKRIIPIVIVFITLLSSTATFAASRDAVQLVDIGASNFTNKLNSNNMEIFVAEPSFISPDGPRGTAVYESKIYRMSMNSGKIVFFINGSGYISAMMINIVGANNESEIFKGFDFVKYALEVIGLNPKECAVIFDAAVKTGDNSGYALCSSTFRVVHVQFIFSDNGMNTVITAYEP